MFTCGLRVHTPPTARQPGCLPCGKRGKFSTHLCIRKAREEQTPTKTYWNPRSAAELPGLVRSLQYTAGVGHRASGVGRQALGIRYRWYHFLGIRDWASKTGGE